MDQSVPVGHPHGLWTVLKKIFQQLSVNQIKDIIQLYDFDLKITFIWPMLTFLKVHCHTCGLCEETYNEKSHNSKKSQKSHIPS